MRLRYTVDKLNVTHILAIFHSAQSFSHDIYLRSGVHFTKVFRTELGHKYILVECSVIALCLPVMSKITRYILVCYK